MSTNNERPSIDPVEYGKLTQAVAHLVESLDRFVLVQEKCNEDTSRRIKALEDIENNRNQMLSGSFHTIKGVGFVIVLIFLFAAKGLYGVIQQIVEVLRGG